MGLSTLTERQRRFVVAFTGEAMGNQTQAAIIAGYSPKTARFQASDLLTRPHIQEAVLARQTRLETKADIKDSRILEELAEVAYTKVEIKGNEKLKALELLAKHKGLLQSEVSPQSRITVNIGFLNGAPTQPQGQLPVIDVSTKG